MVCKCNCAFICVKYNEALIQCHKSPVLYGKTFDIVKKSVSKQMGLPFTAYALLHTICNLQINNHVIFLL